MKRNKRKLKKIFEVKLLWVMVWIYYYDYHLYVCILMFLMQYLDIF